MLDRTKMGLTPIPMAVIAATLALTACGGGGVSGFDDSNSGRILASLLNDINAEDDPADTSAEDLGSSIYYLELRARSDYTRNQGNRPVNVDSVNVNWPAGREIEFGIDDANSWSPLFGDMDNRFAKLNSKDANTILKYGGQLGSFNEYFLSRETTSGSTYALVYTDKKQNTPTESYDNHLVFGVWVHESADGAWASPFAGGGDYLEGTQGPFGNVDSNSGQFQSVRDTATYRGKAAGLYMSETQDGVGRRVQYFHADTVLEAVFDGNVGLFGLSVGLTGTIDNFVVEDERFDGSVSLTSKSLSKDPDLPPHSYLGKVKEAEAVGSVGDNRYVGYWEGAFYNLDTLNTAPNSFAGTFSVAHGDENSKRTHRFTGGFATSK